MTRLMPTCRRLCFVLTLLCSGLASGPVAAQKMSDDGFELPWFHSRAERMARDACENDLPECRDSVRKQIAMEKAISRTLPWILLCLAVWGAVRYVQSRDKRRQAERDRAARYHVRQAVRERDDQADRARRDDGDDELESGLGVGTPAEKGGRGWR